ncbi:(E2-independent) E3 ubiquitin-conjugating enzyme FATS isoform X1 [Leopardus geoffroyi]|uniref:(E2-independent) E3 ubiquitin-conjugating enzyme FATS isoform X1 n=2 Tax=Leopardus geoffroyi TaxID=46844 RepID=UPI001E25E9E5|nr:(E2-independent) E3 ubiquitin-conjugating enzyme FATS isoform X1 [Leopardus geoffroyi]
MQHSGIPTKSHQKGFATRHGEEAVHRTFQIKAFSTELKNHVMVMDFVKSKWFPSQRRAKVCVIRMYQGLKTAEQTAGRYEIHSQLFSSPKDHSAWERNEGLSKQETLASQNPKMISSVVLSQLIDENKSKANRAALPAPCASALHARPAKPSRATRSGVSISRAFALLPGKRAIQTPARKPGPDPELPSNEEKPCSGPQRGFASITITARRVGPPASALAWEAVGDPLCTKCTAPGALLGDPSAPAGGTYPRPHHGPFTCTEFSRNCSVVTLKLPETHPRPCGGHECWVTNVDNRENGFPPGAPRSGKRPLVFSSCIHLRVSQQCPNSIYYLDPSLSVPIEQPQLAGPKMHRSVLSLHLNCSSHRLTPDGVDGTENGGPMSRALKPELTEGNQTLLGPRWNPGLHKSPLKENPLPEQAHLRPSACAWSGSPLLENTAFSEVGANQVTERKGKEDCAARHAGDGANQLSIHIPGWSYTAVETKVFSGSSKKQQGEARTTLSAPPVAQKLVKDFLPEGCSSPSNTCQSSNFSEPSGSRQQSVLKSRILFPGFFCPLQDVCTSPQEDNGVQVEREFPKGDYKCCDLVVKIKECRKREEPEPAPPEPAPPEPAPPARPETPDLSEDCSEYQQTPAGSLTLQEALEVRKPQFISRSQERLKKLEHMIQQRKAQRKENLAQKQSLFPVRADKKQFTVPHPLSDNLFKPKERYISEKEMHLRSKRIYNNLPEVKRKKEEQKKRVILQSNRLRAEVFKKQLLDQLLQRNAV